MRTRKAHNEGEVDGEYSYSVHMTGQATTLPSEPEDDVIERLHAVVEEVTGKPVAKRPKPRIGFLP
ncbi:MAG: hypothetical protein RLZZ373_2622 [Pseudomonadota bacterium]|jgi:hypothetical protein